MSPESSQQAQPKLTKKKSLKKLLSKSNLHALFRGTRSSSQVADSDKDLDFESLPGSTTYAEFREMQAQLAAQRRAQESASNVSNKPIRREEEHRQPALQFQPVKRSTGLQSPTQRNFSKPF